MYCSSASPWRDEANLRRQAATLPEACARHGPVQARGSEYQTSSAERGAALRDAPAVPTGRAASGPRAREPTDIPSARRSAALTLAHRLPSPTGQSTPHARRSFHLPPPRIVTREIPANSLHRLLPVHLGKFDTIHQITPHHNQTARAQHRAGWRPRRTATATSVPWFPTHIARPPRAHGARGGPRGTTHVARSRPARAPARRLPDPLPRAPRDGGAAHRGGAAIQRDGQTRSDLSRRGSSPDPTACTCRRSSSRTLSRRYLPGSCRRG
jgi:hypothetical protein